MVSWPIAVITGWEKNRKREQMYRVQFYMTGKRPLMMHQRLGSSTWFVHICPPMNGAIWIIIKNWRTFLIRRERHVRNQAYSSVIITTILNFRCKMVYFPMISFWTKRTRIT